jgi:hypothetical protein
VLSFTPRPLYPGGKSSRCPLAKRLGGPQCRSGRCGEDKNLSPAGNRTRVVQPVDRRYQFGHVRVGWQFWVIQPRSFNDIENVRAQGKRVLRVPLRCFFREFSALASEA